MHALCLICHEVALQKGSWPLLPMCLSDSLFAYLLIPLMPLANQRLPSLNFRAHEWSIRKGACNDAGSHATCRVLKFGNGGAERYPYISLERLQPLTV